jgi:hypothetical protein
LDGERLAATGERFGEMAMRRVLVPATFCLLAVALAGAVGYLPTRRLASDGGTVAALAGCVTGLLANWLGLGVFALTASSDGRGFAQAVLLGTMVRFVAVLGLSVAVAFSGLFSKAPLLIWIGLSYLVALATETVWLVRLDKRLSRE